MGDFERTYGAGANFDSILDGYNRDHRLEQREIERKVKASTKAWFLTFQSAAEWAKANPGKAFARAPSGIGFEEK